MKELKIESHLNSHIRCVEILEAIQTFQKRIKLNKESLDGFPGEFVELRKKYINSIDTQERCIIRLFDNYLSLITEINLSLD
jgi:hypothetical protein